MHYVRKEFRKNITTHQNLATFNNKQHQQIPKTMFIISKLIHKTLMQKNPLVQQQNQN